jgi:hypothetical protein
MASKPKSTASSNEPFTLTEPVATAPKASFAPTKPDTDPNMKTRTLVHSVAMGIQFSSMLLANKDADNEGWDDFFAFKLHQLSSEMQHFAATGKLPTDSE